ncbi:hypothetical protein [Serratia oryzae]|uniref:Uncharacterized protein n=1 Tax=Serratia oryzae TaxID=2034155 RepID=A0A1S8CL58_9GAMM|nr:hypothetical protein [Serratia oryzae]OMQ23698.1 hypothetical protein BMI79_09300 [Serratia oryzae]
MNDNKMTEIDIINDLVSKMSEEEANEYISYIHNQDSDGINSIVKKYGYMFVKPISNIISEHNVDDLFGGREDIIIPALMSSFSNAAKRVKEERKFSKEKSVNQVDSISELRELDKRINNKESANHYMKTLFNEEINVMLKAKMILESAGCDYISSELDDIINKTTINLILTKPIENMKKKEIISEDRRKAGKGNISPHKFMAVKIAADTWEKYPNASQEGLVDEIFLYFRKKWNDNPSSGAIKGWLSESGLNPKVKPKNRKFTLVINE